MTEWLESRRGSRFDEMEPGVLGVLNVAASTVVKGLDGFGLERRRVKAVEICLTRLAVVAVVWPH